MPEIPTLHESGLAGFDTRQWLRHLVPTRHAGRGGPRLYTESAKALAPPDVKERLAQSALSPSAARRGSSRLHSRRSRALDRNRKGAEARAAVKCGGIVAPPRKPQSRAAQAVTLPRSPPSSSPAPAAARRASSPRASPWCQSGEASPPASSRSPSPTRRRARCSRGSRRCCRSTRAACGSAPSTACATGCCARITATRACRSSSRSSIRRPARRDQAAAKGRTSTRRSSRRASCRTSSTAARKQACAPTRCEAGDEFTRRMVAFYADYDAQCNREGVVDFAELLLRTFELLARNLNSCSSITRRFRYILVDEFQDTNKLQYRWIKMLAGRRCVFAVGDDDQSIYRFRGAEVGNMNEFVRDFDVKRGGEARAELPLAGPHPRRGQRDHRAEQGAPRQEPVDRRRQGRAAARLRRRQRRRGGALHRGRGEPLHREGMRSPTWRCSTARTPSRASSSTRSSARASPTRSTAACASSSARRSSTRSRTCASPPTPDDDTAFTRVVNFPPRGIGTRSIEQLQEAAERGMGSLMHVAKAASSAGAAARRSRSSSR